jgi:hypothetical protein
VAADKVSLARAKIKEDVTCRKCRVQRETLGHILGLCTSTKRERISRHDSIKDLTLKRVVENDTVAVVTRETSLQLPHGAVLKPDLVIQNMEGVFVVDITVRHEDGDNLHRGRLEKKIEKYKKLLPDLQRRYNSNKAEVLPIVIGTRGELPQKTISCLKTLNIKNIVDLRAMSLTALKRSIEIYSNCMNYDNYPKGRLRTHRNYRNHDTS